MGGAVAIDGQSFGTVGSDEPNLRVLLEREREIDEPIVDRRGECGLGQTRRDRNREVADGSTRRNSTAGAVWKRDGDVAHGTESGLRMAASRKLPRDRSALMALLKDQSAFAKATARQPSLCWPA